MRFNKMTQKCIRILLAISLAALPQVSFANGITGGAPATQAANQARAAAAWAANNPQLVQYYYIGYLFPEYPSLPATLKTGGNVWTQGGLSDAKALINASLAKTKTLNGQPVTNIAYLASLLRSNDYAGAWAFAAQTNLFRFLETAYGPSLLGLPSFTPAQIDAYYTAAEPYWSQLTQTPYPYSYQYYGQSWGDGGGRLVSGGAANNLQSCQQHTSVQCFPDPAQYESQRPSGGFFDSGFFDILMEVSQVAAIALVTWGIGTALAPAAVAITAPADGAVVASSAAVGADGAALVTASSTSSFLGTTLSVTEAGVTTTTTSLTTAGTIATNLVAGEISAVAQGHSAGDALLYGALGSAIGLGVQASGLDSGLSNLGITNSTAINSINGVVASTVGGCATGNCASGFINGLMGAPGGAASGSIDTTIVTGGSTGSSGAPADTGSSGNTNIAGTAAAGGGFDPSANADPVTTNVGTAATAAGVGLLVSNGASGSGATLASSTTGAVVDSTIGFSSAAQGAGTALGFETANGTAGSVVATGPVGEQLSLDLGTTGTGTTLVTSENATDSSPLSTSDGATRVRQRDPVQLDLFNGTSRNGTLIVSDGAAGAGGDTLSSATIARPRALPAVDGLSPNATLFSNLPTSNALDASGLNDWVLGNNGLAIDTLGNRVRSFSTSWASAGPQTDSLLTSYQQAANWQSPGLDFNVGSVNSQSIAIGYGNDSISTDVSAGGTLPDGFVNINVHGGPNGLAANVNGNWVDISPQTIASDLNTVGASGRPILLNACNGVCTAQSLADATGSPVIAANGYVHGGDAQIISSIDNSSPRGVLYGGDRYALDPGATWSVFTPSNTPAYLPGQAQMTVELQLPSAQGLAVNTDGIQVLNPNFAMTGNQTSSVSLVSTSDGTQLVARDFSVGEDGATAIARATNLLAGQNSIVLPVAQNGTTLYSQVASGISYGDLSPAALANANSQVLQFSQQVISEYGTYANTPGGGRVIFDSNPYNFRFDANGNIVANIDPFYYDASGTLTANDVLPQWRTPTSTVASSETRILGATESAGSGTTVSGAASGSGTTAAATDAGRATSAANAGNAASRVPASIAAASDAAPGTTLVMNIGSRGLTLAAGAAETGGELLLIDTAATTGTAIGGTIRQNFPNATAPLDGVITDIANNVVDLQSQYYNCQLCRVVGGVASTVVQNDLAEITVVGSRIGAACASSSTCSAVVSWGRGLASDYQNWKSNTLVPAVQSATQTTINVATGLYNFVTGRPVTVNVGGVRVGFNDMRAGAGAGNR